MLTYLSTCLNSVLDKTLKGIRAVVCDSITERFFRAPGPRTKYLKCKVFFIFYHCNYLS